MNTQNQIMIVETSTNTFATYAEAVNYLIQTQLDAIFPTPDTTTGPCDTCEADGEECATCEENLDTSVEDKYLAKFAAVTADLEDPRFTLRSAAALCAKYDFANEADLMFFLTANGVDYVIKTKRSDGSTLVGLAARN